MKKIFLIGWKDVPLAFRDRAGLLLLVFGLVLRDRLKAGIIVSLFVLLFSLYGGAFSAIGRSHAVHEFARHQYLLPAWLLLWLFCSWLVVRMKRSLNGATVLLNVAAAAIVLTNVVTGLPAFLRNVARPARPAEAAMFSSRAS